MSRSTSNLGLPAEIRGLLFDLDGVLTKTAKVHARAWKEMFDAYLHESGRDEDFVGFDERLITTSTSTANLAMTVCAPS